MPRTKTRGISNPKIEVMPSTPEAWVSQGAETALEAKQEGPKKRITLTVTEELHKKVHIYARTKGVTVTDLVTEFLENVIQEN